MWYPCNDIIWAKQIDFTDMINKKCLRYFSSEKGTDVQVILKMPVSLLESL